MLSKKDLKDIQSLTHKKHRDSSRSFIAEGPKVVSELLRDIPGQLLHLYATEEWIEANRHTSFHPTMIGEPELARISQLTTPNQVFAVFQRLESVPPRNEGFILYLDRIQDPGNFGTIIRTADWFGLKNIVCSRGCADLYNAKVIQSTMSSIARVNVYLDENSEWFSNARLPKIAAVLDGIPLDQFQGASEGIIIIGNESKGIDADLLKDVSFRLKIPGKGGAESLNAAVATGIILSHLVN